MGEKRYGLLKFTSHVVPWVIRAACLRLLWRSAREVRATGLTLPLLRNIGLVSGFAGLWTIRMQGGATAGMGFLKWCCAADDSSGEKGDLLPKPSSHQQEQTPEVDVKSGCCGGHVKGETHDDTQRVAPTSTSDGSPAIALPSPAAPAVLDTVIGTQLAAAEEKRTHVEANSVFGPVAPVAPMWQSLPTEQPLISRVDIRVGRILKAWRHPEDSSLTVEEVDVGGTHPWQVVSKFSIPLKKIKGAKVLLVVNLEPFKVAGLMSYGLVLTAVNAAESKMELLQWADGSQLGERITVQGMDLWSHKPDSKVDVTDQTHALARLLPFLSTNADCVPCFEGTPLASSAGTCYCKSIVGSVA